MDDIRDLNSKLGINKYRNVSKKPKLSSEASEKSKKNVQSSDKLELSQHAKWLKELKEMDESSINKNRLEEIKNKIANGDYNKDEVYEEVANSIMKEWETN